MADNALVTSVTTILALGTAFLSINAVRRTDFERVLRDAENHHERGVQDADENPVETDRTIGEVSSVVGTVPDVGPRMHGTDIDIGLSTCHWDGRHLRRPPAPRHFP